MKYIVIREHKAGDWFTEEFNDQAEALKRLHQWFNHLSNYDKKQTRAMFLLESINPDEEAENHFDGDIIEKLI